MNMLSDKTIVTIVAVLAGDYERVRKQVEFWDHPAQQGVPNLEQLKRDVRTRLEQREAAIKELAEEAAPWIRRHVDFVHLFQAEATNQLTEEKQ